MISLVSPKDWIPTERQQARRETVIESQTTFLYPTQMKSVFHSIVLAATALVIAGCARAPEEADVCSNADGALDGGFVFATTPHPGERVRTGFKAKGCSRTFESTVNWKLTARDGSTLASGHTQGGGVDGPGPFEFDVAYSVTEPQIAHLEVYEEDASDGEGAPPGRTVIPLVLQP